MDSSKEFLSQFVYHQSTPLCEKCTNTGDDKCTRSGGRAQEKCRFGWSSWYWRQLHTFECFRQMRKQIVVQTTIMHRQVVVRTKNAQTCIMMMTTIADTLVVLTTNAHTRIIVLTRNAHIPRLVLNFNAQSRVLLLSILTFAAISYV